MWEVVGGLEFVGVGGSCLSPGTYQVHFNWLGCTPWRRYAINASLESLSVVISWHLAITVEKRTWRSRL